MLIAIDKYLQAVLKYFLIALRLCLFPMAAFAQSEEQQRADMAHSLNGVVVTGIQPSSPKATSLHIESYPLAQLQEKAPYNLSDALAKIPGVGQMSTGNAISKPVVRGLFGNRVLVLLSGLRFDNQQFQDEHGLGLSQIGIDRVELIKGPGSLLYGTDAVGGVINVIEETPKQPGRLADINLRLYSNTAGTLTDVGLINSTGSGWWRLRAGYESHGDYTDGDGRRVYDSRNTGYYLKAGYGFSRKDWESNNAYNFSFNQYGFILDSLNNRAVQDARWSRDMEEPHHNVLLNIFSSQNTIRLRRSAADSITKGSLLKVNAGFQSNRRAEDEGGGEISLNMHLLSLLQSTRWEKFLTPQMLLVLNEQATYERNTNYGKRIIIPDAHMLEGNVSAFVRLTMKRLIVESGFGITHKQITTLPSGKLNGPGKINQPFTAGSPVVNEMVGFSYNPTLSLHVKGNIATGLRTGNLAELASEGLHEGSFRYEIGNPALKPEQNVNTDLTAEWSRPHWFISLSGFYNHFSNYIYLTPTTDTFNGIFQIFRYVQQDARLYGGELIVAYKPTAQIQLKECLTAVDGKATTTDEHLPFIPPLRSVTSLRIDHSFSGLKSFYAEPEVEYAFAQNKPARFELPTPDYTLVHLHAGGKAYFHKHAFVINLSVRNLLNRTYADHLSRLRYFGISNQGINVVLSVRTTLSW